MKKILHMEDQGPLAELWKRIYLFRYKASECSAEYWFLAKIMQFCSRALWS